MIRKNGIVKDKEDFVSRVVFVALAFAQHKVSYKPEKLEYDSPYIIAKEYIKFCNSLEKEVLQKYKENLEWRFKNKFPSDAIPLPDPNAKKRELTVEDLKAYDAFNMYIAKINNRKFEMTDEGKLIYEEIVSDETFQDNHIKPLDEFFLD